MLDIRKIREAPEEVILKLKKRREDGYEEEIREIGELDRRRRQLLTQTDEMKATRNAVSRKIPQMKKEGTDTAPVMAEMKRLGDEIARGEEEAGEIEKRLRLLLYAVPNTPHESVPEGADSEDNREIRRYGEPRVFDFPPKPHWELGAALDILDPERAAKVTGTRFTFYKGAGARLERAIVNFFLDLHTRRGYTEMIPPFMVNRASMTGTGQLPKFEEDAFRIEAFDYFMTPTAEVPVTNYYRDEILDAERLPQKFCAYSACFRAEAGSAGRDTRGLIRQHQFNKVELVKFVRPEESGRELESLTEDAAAALELLELPYRVVALCGGDLGFSSAKTYDIEVWLPSYGRYAEISSCSNYEDFQARRMNIRYREAQGERPQTLHTLNGSGLAAGRTTAAVLENFQRSDGSVRIPDVLIPYMDGVTEIRRPE